MIAAIYARKSTDQHVADEAKSVTRQVDGAKAFIALKGWTVADEHVYTDDGASGALFANRQEFQRMMRDAAASAFEAVVFYDLDRFERLVGVNDPRRTRTTALPRRGDLRQGGEGVQPRAAQGIEAREGASRRSGPPTT